MGLLPRGDAALPFLGLLPPIVQGFRKSMDKSEKVLMEKMISECTLSPRILLFQAIWIN